MQVTEAELEELEAVEAWVEMMADFEEQEQEHLLTLAIT
jgi:hypothetical protein